MIHYLIGPIIIWFPFLGWRLEGARRRGECSLVLVFFVLKPKQTKRKNTTKKNPKPNQTQPQTKPNPKPNSTSQTPTQTLNRCKPQARVGVLRRKGHGGLATAPEGGFTSALWRLSSSVPWAARCLLSRNGLVLMLEVWSQLLQGYTAVVCFSPACSVSLMLCLSHPLLLSNSTLFQIFTWGVAVEDKNVFKEKYCLVK